MNYKLSVIVPVYNVRGFIGRCVECLMKQTLKEIEYIFVDDCSEDDSYDVLMESLSKFQDRSGDVKVIRHETNKGVSVSRTEGLAAATGDFVIQCDADDWTDVTMYEKMYSKVIEDKADICLCDFFFAERDSMKRENIGLDCTKSHDEIVYDYLSCMWTMSWNFMVRHDLYLESGVRLPEDITFTEDFYLTTCLMCLANGITYVKEPLYYYNQQNPNSIIYSGSYNYRDDERKSCEKTIEWMKAHGVYKKYHKPLQWHLIKASCDLVLLNRFDEFRSIHPESHRYIFSAPRSLIEPKVKLMLALTMLRMDFLCRWENKRHGR